MTSFSQWWRSLEKNPKPRQFTWLCGDQPVLVEEVLTHIKKRVAPDTWNLVSLAAGDDSERVIWQAMDSHPIDDGTRLVVVRNAEQLTQWERLEEWLRFRSLNPLTYAVFLSNEERVPRVDAAPNSKTKTVIAPHLANINPRGHVIECRAFTQSSAITAVEWVMTKAKMRRGVAGHLLDRANGDLRRVRDICAKLAVFPGEVSITTVNALMSERPGEEFSDALLALDKKTAFLALREIDPSEYPRLIGLLDSRLELAGTVHDMVLQRRSQSEIARMAGTQGFLVRDIVPVAKTYDAKRRFAIRQLLAQADEMIRGGARTAVMESVVTLW